MLYLRIAVVIGLSTTLHFLLLALTDISTPPLRSGTTSLKLNYAVRSREAFMPQQNRLSDAAAGKSVQPPKTEQVAEQKKQQPRKQALARVQQKTSQLAPEPVSQVTTETSRKVLQVNVARLRISSEQVDEEQQPDLLSEGPPSQDRPSPAAADQGSDNSQPVVQEPAYRTAQPRYAVNPKPEYPRVAKLRGWQGDVLFQVEVLASGRVGRVSLVASSGYRSLDRAARKALRRWVFKPATNMGVPVASEVRIPIHFALE